MNVHPILPPAAIVQNCYVVADLDAACRDFNRLYGIGPFLGGDAFALEQHVYRGTPADPIRARGVFVQSGDLNIELIELLSDAPSAFHDMFPRKGDTGLHHTAMFADDYDATCAALAAGGCPVISEFSVPALGAKICYADTRALNGHMLEIYPENEGIRAMYAMARDAARTWDGKRLIIPWTDL